MRRFIGLSFSDEIKYVAEPTAFMLYSSEKIGHKDQIKMMEEFAEKDDFMVYGMMDLAKNDAPGFEDIKTIPSFHIAQGYMETIKHFSDDEPNVDPTKENLSTYFSAFINDFQLKIEGEEGDIPSFDHGEGEDLPDDVDPADMDDKDPAEEEDNKDGSEEQ